MSAAKKLEIDWTRCDGHGLCATLLPEEIALDEWGYPVIERREITAGDVPNARRAVLACPALALRLATAVKRDPVPNERPPERTVPAPHQ